ncbi:hypothetical protein KHA80_06135 [Anaerobacillus sp. HL2]|nr:hypothetical protein KHA80_06135 [Anaerobacillus sp. HL2]
MKTFTVGFETEGYSEVDVAKETAEKLGIEKHLKDYHSRRVRK